MRTSPTPPAIPLNIRKLTGMMTKKFPWTEFAAPSARPRKPLIAETLLHTVSIVFAMFKIVLSRARRRGDTSAMAVVVAGIHILFIIL
jgi:hypothetical protein